MKIFILTEEQVKHIKEFKDSDNPNLGAGLLAISKKTGNILICKRGKDITYPNQWCVVGGMCKKGESAKNGALREFKEETGYGKRVGNLKKLRQDRKGKLKYVTFIGLVNDDFKPPMVNKVTVDGAVEIQDYKWLSLEELINYNKGKIHFGLKRTISEKDKIQEFIEKYCK